MEKQVPAGISNIFEKIALRHQEARRKAEAEREKYPLAKALYEKANAVVEEFGIEQMSESGKVVLFRETPPVKLVSGDKRLEFMIKEGYRVEHERFRRIQIHQRREGDDYFNSNPLFKIRLFWAVGEEDIDGILETPLEESASPEAIQAVSDIVDVIQQSLSETHIPWSQQVKPAEPKRGLTALFRRLTPRIAKP